MRGDDLRSSPGFIRRSNTFFLTRKNSASFPRKRDGGLAEAGCAPGSLKDIRHNITILRLIKSPTEIAFLREAIDLSAPMRTLPPSK